MPIKRELSKQSARRGRRGNSGLGHGGEFHQWADPNHAALTTNQGMIVSDNQNSLKGSPRGSTLLDDFVLREKITHFDHERIPEREVHARGTAAHGFFELTKSLRSHTTAKILTDVGTRTPLCARFSTVREPPARRSHADGAAPGAGVQ